MIVAVKRNKKQKIIRILSLAFVALMLVGYYFHMSSQMAEQDRIDMETKKAAKLKEEKIKETKKNFERAVLSEIEKAVDLVGQENVQHVKIIENKLVIICELKTNLDALMVRYGTLALIKNTLNEIIVAIDLKYIMERKKNV
ncbi:hypothetical protein [Poseidonibacter lekithochrous]|uniref:hypothetical protein n=1 Tax=Poseidonibacter lekithochrous TaxID=1904463 RepID=UPI0008FC8F3E|nr:hypothetical protein [Poseidonibacter lekithochrous]QKJ24354.1 hypothetical protein ALEK_3144 [Poseidonibacter lekithochrous]